MQRAYIEDSSDTVHLADEVIVAEENILEAEVIEESGEVTET